MFTQVFDFTEASGHTCPNKPSAMTRKEVEFASKMVLDEVMELMATVHPAEESKRLLKTFIETSRDLEQTPNEEDVLPEQADAMVDILYYIMNAACKKGINIEEVFTRVHEANMAKRDPSTGKFIIRESDGKIMKPPGWTPPDIKKEMATQTKEGSFYRTGSFSQTL